MDNDIVDEFAVSSHWVARRAYGRAARLEKAPGYEKIPQELSTRLLQRLTSLAIEPAVVLDVGTPLAQRQAEICQMYPQALMLQSAWHEQQFGCAAALPTPGSAGTSGSSLRRLSKRMGTQMARLLGAGAGAGGRFSADPGQLPLADSTVDLVIACQVLPWCGDPGALFQEVHRVLTPGGAFFWSSAGPDTLGEYRQLWSSIDTYPHVFGLQDMHDLGDDMLRSGFDSPVMDRENLNINYTDLDSLQSDLRAAGAANLAAGRRKGLMARSVRQRLAQQSLAGLAVTIEHIQGHGWKASNSSGVRRNEQTVGSSEVRIPVSAVGRSVGRSVGRHRPGDD